MHTTVNGHIIEAQVRKRRLGLVRKYQELADVVYANYSPKYFVSLRKLPVVCTACVQEAAPYLEYITKTLLFHKKKINYFAFSAFLTKRFKNVTFPATILSASKNAGVFKKKFRPK